MAGENINFFREESSNGEGISESEGRQKSQNVFLCHSGKQKNFVRQLYRDLTKEGLSCFFDEDLQSLPLAQKFASHIFQATETCKVAVLILSEDFFQSKWPMLELSAFLRNIKSEWQASEISQEMRAEWQNAVREVRPINGLKLSEGENEVSFRDKIVENVCSLLPLPQPPTLHPPPSPPQQAPKRRKVQHLIRIIVIISTAHHNIPCFFNLIFFHQQRCSSGRY